MPNGDPEADETREAETDEVDGDEHEVERVVTREQGAAALRRLADGVAEGSVEFGGGAIAAAIPERFELEIEYEREDEAAELEVELEWPVDDGEATAADAAGDADPDEAGDSGTEMGDPGAETGEPGVETDGDESAGDPVDDLVGVGGEASNATFELYRDRGGEWRWRLVHRNGNIIADSGEGYDRKATARNGLESVMRNAPGAAIDLLDD